MANSNRWGDFKGALANIVAPGKVYDTYKNSYAPRNVTIARLASGAASQLGGPVGTIAGLVGGMASDRMEGAQQFDRGADSTSADIYNSREQLREQMNSQISGVEVNDIGAPPMSGMGAPSGMVASGMGGNYGPMRGGYQFPQAQTTSGQPDTQTSYGVSLPNYGAAPQGGLAGFVSGGSNYGPYQGGYQTGAPAPTTSGLPNRDMGYASLPNYGEQGQQMQQPTQGGGSMGSGATQGTRDRGAGHSGEAARSMFEGMTDATRFAPIVGYGRNLDRGN